MPVSFQHIAPFLHQQANRTSKWIGYIGLGVGVVLLLCSVQMYINIDLVLKNKSPRKNGYDYISITKTVTNDNMGSDNRFDRSDLNELRAQPFIEGAAPLKANAFKISAGAGSVIPFTADIFIESLNNQFIDTVPPSFIWSPGQEEVPIIFSTDFLEMYNIFAPSWDLPQLSQQTAENVHVFLKCEGHDGTAIYKARIVAFSDRVSSILVPENFLSMLNKELEGLDDVKSSRVFIKTKDANDTRLLNFLQQKGYYINKDKTRFGRVKQVLEGVMSGLTGFGVLIVLLAMMLFSFYLQLIISRSKENLQLLLTLGYSPRWLSRTVSRQWVPVYAGIIFAAVLFTATFQWYFKSYMMQDNEQLSAFVHPLILVLAAGLLAITAFVNYKLVSRLLARL